MIRLRRVWYNFVAEYHQERQLDHARRRDSALRKLEQMERRRQRQQVQQDIKEILSKRKLNLVHTSGDRNYLGPNADRRFRVVRADDIH